jgi:hypothetical protein
MTESSSWTLPSGTDGIVDTRGDEDREGAPGKLEPEEGLVEGKYPPRRDGGGVGIECAGTALGAGVSTGVRPSNHDESDFLLGFVNLNPQRVRMLFPGSEQSTYKLSVSSSSEGTVGAEAAGVPGREILGDSVPAGVLAPSTDSVGFFCCRFLAS